MSIKSGEDILAADFLTTSTGATDAGKGIRLDGAGKIDSVNEKAPSEGAFTAGETINGNTLPVAVYQDTADNEFKVCDANDTAKLQFIGFAVSNSTDGNAINIQFNGIVSGFTGLSEGTKYYVQDDKTIGTTPGTYDILVGIAVSTTEIIIQKEKLSRYYTVAEDSSHGFGAGSDTHDVVITCGFRPKFIELVGGIATGSVPTYQHNFYWSSNNVFAPVWYNIPLNAYHGMSTNNNKVITADSIAHLFQTISGAGETVTLTITSITDTGFTLHFSKIGTDSWTFLWQFLIKVSN